MNFRMATILIFLRGMLKQVSNILKNFGHMNKKHITHELLVTIVISVLKLSSYVTELVFIE